MASVPITTHERLGNSSNGPRRSLRHRIGPLVYMDLGLSNGGFPINVSEDGVGFQGILPLAKDQLLTIKFKLPDVDHTVETAGQVVWVNEIRTGGGLRFVDLPENSRLLIKNWISSENQAASAGASLETPKVKSAFPAAPGDIQLVSASSVPAVEKKNTAQGAKQIGSATGQTTSFFTAAQIETVAAPVSTPSSFRLSDSAPVLGTPAFLRGGGQRRARFTRSNLLAISGVVIVGMVVMISLESGPGTLIERMRGNIAQLFGGSAPATLLAPPPASEISDRSRIDPAVAAPILNPAPSTAISTPVLNAPAREKSPVAPQLKETTVTGPRVKTGSQNTSTKRLSALTKVYAPRSVVSLPATEVAPPALLMPAGQQPAPLLPMRLPEPPAPGASRTVQQTPKLESARLLSRRDPVYPPLARANHYSGSVDLLFTIGADGKVHNIRVAKGIALLAQPAVEALKTWRFEPARRDGIPIDSESSTVVTFKLN